MSIDDRYKIPADATANVHSVSAIGEQYLDLVSTGNPGSTSPTGRRSPTAQCPARSAPRWMRPTTGLAVLPEDKIDGLLTETV